MLAITLTFRKRALNHNSISIEIHNQMLVPSSTNLNSRRTLTERIISDRSSFYTPWLAFNNLCLLENGVAESVYQIDESFVDLYSPQLSNANKGDMLCDRPYRGSRRNLGEFAVESEIALFV